MSPDFRWPDDRRTDDPQTLLMKEGVQFDDAGRAAPQQRFTSQELAVLVGLQPESLPAALATPAAGGQSDLRDLFVSQLGSAQDPDTVHGVLSLLNGWTNLSGHLEFGQAGEVSCYLMARPAAKLSDKVWPFTVYPSGKVEVVFQWMLWRPPFDGLEVREEFRQRLNQITDVDIPAAKVSMRPGFHVDVLRSAAAREALLEHLAWFKGLADRIAKEELSRQLDIPVG